MMERIGQQIGSYQLIHHIGQGGFADVYVGQDISLNTQVAIKVLHAELTYEKTKKFLEQAHTISSLDHPHIVRILDFGIENNTPFFVMDYAPHGTLRQRHPKGTQLPLSTVVVYVKPLADALQYVHELGFIHRDIKPHNMLIGPQHQIMLSDFGTSVVAESMGYRRQKIQEFEGTILYAAPEQIRGKPRISSDQYALGIVIYEWLTGSWPFYGTVEEIANQHTLALPAPLSQKVPTLPLAVEQVVLKALAKDPYERFESIQAFAKALERASRLEQTSYRIGQPLTPLPTPLSLTIEEKLDLPPTEAPLLTYQGHSDKIHMLAWSPDSKYIASSRLDETIQIWDALTGTTIFTIRSSSLQPQVLTWSPDSTLLALTSGLSCETIQIWDVSTGRVIFIYRGHSAPVTNVAWSPDSRRIASASVDKTAQAWDATTGSNIAIFYGHRAKVNAVTYSPGNTLIASASDDTTVQVWDSSTGRKVLIYKDHTAGASSAVWSPNGMSIASSSLDETVHVWNALTGTILFMYTGHTDWVGPLSWSPHGKRIASGSWDKTVQVWAVKSVNPPPK